MKIVNVYDGKLPVKIYALKEGTILPGLQRSSEGFVCQSRAKERSPQDFVCQSRAGPVFENKCETEASGEVDGN